MSKNNMYYLNIVRSIKHYKKIFLSILALVLLSHGSIIAAEKIKGHDIETRVGGSDPLEAGIPSGGGGSSACDAIPIMQADLPLTISTPGIYCVAQELTSGTDYAITIAIDNVNLDLNGHTITDGGVLINEGLTDITVKNGIINDAPKSGVRASQATRLTLDNLSINNGLGVYNAMSSSLSDAPIRLAYGSTNTNINQNVVIRGCVLTGNAGCAVDLENPQNVLISGCQARANGDGFYLVDTDPSFATNHHNVVIQDCISNDSSFTGFFLDKINDAAITNCNANNVAFFSFRTYL